MGRGSRFLESSATEEDSYEYRVEWDDIITVDYDGQSVKTEHHGSGSRDVFGFKRCVWI